jgi:hypothetical protein
VAGLERQHNDIESNLPSGLEGMMRKCVSASKSSLTEGRERTKCRVVKNVWIIPLRHVLVHDRFSSRAKRFSTLRVSS